MHMYDYYFNGSWLVYRFRGPFLFLHLKLLKDFKSIAMWLISHCQLVGGWNMFYFSIQLGMSSSQVTNSIIFFRCPYIGNNNPKWLIHIFQRGRLKPATSQPFWKVGTMIRCLIIPFPSCYPQTNSWLRIGSLHFGVHWEDFKSLVHFSILVPSLNKVDPQHGAMFKIVYCTIIYPGIYYTIY